MNRTLLCLLSLVVGAAMGACMTVDPPIPCYDNSDFTCDKAEKIPPLGAEELVCNEAVSLEQACQEFLAGLPAGIPIPPVCDFIPSFENIGTCQPPGELEFPCAEDPDCLPGLVCDPDTGKCAEAEEEGV